MSKVGFLFAFLLIAKCSSMPVEEEANKSVLAPLSKTPDNTPELVVAANKSATTDATSSEVVQNSTTPAPEKKDNLINTGKDEMTKEDGAKSKEKFDEKTIQKTDLQGDSLKNETKKLGEQKTETPQAPPQASEQKSPEIAEKVQKPSETLPAAALAASMQGEKPATDSEPKSLEESAKAEKQTDPKPADKEEAAKAATPDQKATETAKPTETIPTATEPKGNSSTPAKEQPGASTEQPKMGTTASQQPNAEQTETQVTKTLPSSQTTNGPVKILEKQIGLEVTEALQTSPLLATAEANPPDLAKAEQLPMPQEVQISPKEMDSDFMIQKDEEAKYDLKKDKMKKEEYDMKKMEKEKKKDKKEKSKA